MDNNALDQLARDHEGCSIAAFADIEVGIVLRTGADLDVGQETLNSLCAKGKQVFGAMSSPSDLAIQAIDKTTLIFVRVPDDPSSVLIAQCDRTVPLNDFIPQARACVEGGQ